MTHRWDKASGRLPVEVTFPKGETPQKNELWWSPDRHPDYSIQMEYDAWHSQPLRQTAKGAYAADIEMARDAKNVQFLTTHAHTEAGSTLTISSPLLQAK